MIYTCICSALLSLLVLIVNLTNIFQLNQLITATAIIARVSSATQSNSYQYIKTVLSPRVCLRSRGERGAAPLILASDERGHANLNLSHCRRANGIAHKYGWILCVCEKSGNRFSMVVVYKHVDGERALARLTSQSDFGPTERILLWPQNNIIVIILRNLYTWHTARTHAHKKNTNFSPRGSRVRFAHIYIYLFNIQTTPDVFLLYI